MNPRSTSHAIPNDQIDLWLVNLDGGDYSEEKAHALLSPDERDRAQRFHFPLHRRRYTIRRGMLRLLLGRYLHQDPASISFSYGSHGKPALPGKELHFNLSHSGNQACFAFSSTSPLGIDLEHVRPMPDLLGVAGTICSSVELTALHSLPPDEQTRAFFTCWTRKEALVKALGQGLSYPLDRISVSFDEPARLLDVQPDQTEWMQWHFHSWEHPWKPVP